MHSIVFVLISCTRFGGQGIATGVRDAHQLAWRIAWLQSLQSPPAGLIDKVLGQWARERRKAVDASVFQTRMNGQLCNEPETWAFYFFRKGLAIYETLPLVPAFPSVLATMERLGFGDVEGALFLPEYGGGAKFPQVFVQDHNHRLARSDDVLIPGPCLLTLLVLHQDRQAIEEAERLLQELPSMPKLLTVSSMATCGVNKHQSSHSDSHDLFQPVTPAASSGFEVRPGYRKEALWEALGKKTRFALLRSDFHIFALLKTSSELEDALRKLHGLFSDATNAARL